MSRGRVYGAGGNAGSTASLVHVRNQAKLHVLTHRLQLFRLRLLRISGLRDVALPGALVLLLALRKEGRVFGVGLDEVLVGLLTAPEVAQRDELRSEVLARQVGDDEVVFGLCLAFHRLNLL